VLFSSAAACSFADVVHPGNPDAAQFVVRAKKLTPGESFTAK